ncbi:lipopolysaccharide-induced tumor necrosis factor-alpha factor-like protein [Leptotrombidium deliense]|uniref:Lipopolysaccharide-induced tumor necrosis factor-alpha factor-like protein n=1 Tax=Leptotrombidium deliense TaxID=299467 RepID=A0A443S6U7_9ACAR|nr:lipopolysaccharide-induced tumor necrosis factor-alpha factor-like protein [Leptotrombidium deliense]
MENQVAQTDIYRSATVVTMITGETFGPTPIKARCPSCKIEVLTNIRPIIGGITWLISGIMCFAGLFCGCCLIPFCLDSSRDTEHRCPICNQTLGVYKRMG